MRSPLLWLCAAALAAGCAAPASSTPPSPTPLATPSAATPEPTVFAPLDPPPAEPLAPTAEAAPEEVPSGPYELRTAIADGGFAQERIEARTLVTLTWVNEDALTHSVVSTDGRFAGSGPIPPGGEFTRTFLMPGEYPFACRYHGGMAGVLVVR